MTCQNLTPVCDEIYKNIFSLFQTNKYIRTLLDHPDIFEEAFEELKSQKDSADIFSEISKKNLQQNMTRFASFFQDDEFLSALIKFIEHIPCTSQQETSNNSIKITVSDTVTNEFSLGLKSSEKPYVEPEFQYENLFSRRVIVGF